MPPHLQQTSRLSQVSQQRWKRLSHMARGTCNQPQANSLASGTSTQDWTHPFYASSAKTTSTKPNTFPYAHFLHTALDTHTRDSFLFPHVHVPGFYTHCTPLGRHMQLPTTSLGALHGAYSDHGEKEPTISVPRAVWG